MEMYPKRWLFLRRKEGRKKKNKTANRHRFDSGPESGWTLLKTMHIHTRSNQRYFAFEASALAATQLGLQSAFSSIKNYYSYFIM